MRKLANLLLILLPASGLVSLVHLFQPDAFGVFLGVAGALIVGSAVILSLLFLPLPAFNRNLPAWALLPQIFLLFWVTCGLRPLTDILGEQTAFISVAIIQVLFGLFALLSLRAANSGSLLLTPERFAAPGFNLGHFLRFLVVGLLAVPAGLILFGFSLTSSYVEQLSGGFVRLGVDGLYMTERTYARGGQTVRLAGMIHIGDQGYYDQLVQSVQTGNTLILAEGVSDQDGLLRQQYSYGSVADLLGLASQEKVRFEGRLIDIQQLKSADFSGAAEDTPDIARGDVDLQEFDPLTVEFINAMGRYLTGSDSFTEGYRKYSNWAEERLTPAAKESIMHDLIDRRNLAVTGYLEDALRKYDHVVIPWGALHMVGIEKNIVERGFLPRENRERRSIDFMNLPYALMMEKLIPKGD